MRHQKQAGKKSSERLNKQLDPLRHYSLDPQDEDSDNQLYG